MLFIERNSLYTLMLSRICAASSRVGVTIKALGFLRAGLSESWSRIGRTKPAVFPVPVCAAARMSWPLRIGGIAEACTGEGFV